jgi:hypothetical protein
MDKAQFIVDVFFVYQNRNTYLSDWSEEYCDLIEAEINLMEKDYQESRKNSFGLADNLSKVNFINRVLNYK